MEIHLTATECRLPYEITQCYLTTDTSDHTLPQPQPDRLVLDLPTPKGWKAELTYIYVTCYISRWFTCPQWAIHTSSVD